MKYIIISIILIGVIFLIVFSYLGAKNKKENFVQKINHKEYDRFVILKNTTENFILKKIKEYGELSGNEEYKVYNFEIANHGDWKILKVGGSISFYVYHNLVGWLEGYDDDPESSDFSIGFSKNKINLQENYIFYLDPENEDGDTLVGVFENKKSFFIYLPEAYEEHGNLTITNDFTVSMKENIDYMSEEGFDFNFFDSLKYTEYKIRMNE